MIEKKFISITHNSVQHDRTKHIEVERHFFKEKLNNDLICILHFLSEINLADLLTKGLNSNKFERVVLKL